MKNFLKKQSKNLKTLAIALVLSLALIAGVMSGTLNGLKTAFADYTATSSFSDSFSIEPTWVTQSNADSAKIKNYAKINMGAEGDFVSYNITGLSAPTVRYDGSSLSEAAPSGVDNYCLGLFACALEKVTGESSDKVYNRMNKSVTGLSKNSYYALTFYVYTAGDATATVKLTGSVEYETATLTSLDSWSKITIFFATLPESYSSLTLNLNYGSFEQVSTSVSTTGYVLFDEINILKITERDFNEQTIDGTAVTGTAMKYNPRTERTVASLIDSNFSSELSVYQKFEEEIDFDKTAASAKDWFYYSPEDLSSLARTNYYNAYNAQTTGETPEAKYFTAQTVREDAVFEDQNTFSDNNYVLKITNKTSDLNLGLVSRAFTVSQLSYYRVSVMMKAETAGNTARLILISKIPTIAEPDGASFTAFRSSSPYTISSQITNNWTEVVLYVRGNAFHDVSTQIALLCGTNSTIYYDHIQIEKITSAEYASASSSYQLDLSPSSLVQSTSIDNGYFNFGTVEDLTSATPYLFAPESWTSSKVGYTDIVSGIVPTRSAVYDDAGENIGAKLGTVANPIPTGAQINVLAIYADPAKLPTSAETLEAAFTTGSTFSLTSSSTMVISFEVFTASTISSANFTGNVIARLTNGDDSVVDFVTHYAAGTGSWETYKIIVRTGTSTPSFKLSIGISEAQGTVFFRNVQFATSLTGYDELLSTYPTWASQKAANIRFVDIICDSSTAHLTQTIAEKDYYKSNNYKVSEVKDADNNVISGNAYVVDVNTGATLSTDLTLTSADLALDGASSDMALVIYNSAEQQSSVTPLGSTTLTKNSYYKLSAWVKTSGSVGDNFTIKINGTDVEFNKVNTAEVTTNNGYVEYIGYIKTSSNDISGVSINFILGTSSTPAEGYVIIRDVKFDDLTETEYTTAVNAVSEENETIKVKDYTASETSNNSSSSSNSSSAEDDETSPSNPLAIFFVVFSSILLVAAMVVAIVAVRIKKSIKPAKVNATNVATVKPKKTTKAKKSNKEPDRKSVV